MRKKGRKENKAEEKKETEWTRIIEKKRKQNKTKKTRRNENKRKETRKKL